MRAGSCSGVILAGGEARRYGGAAKGLERVGGRRIIDRVAQVLAVAADDLLLVANDPDAAAWLPGVPVAADLRPGNGSLGGIHAALTSRGTCPLSQPRYSAHCARSVAEQTSPCRKVPRRVVSSRCARIMIQRAWEPSTVISTQAIGVSSDFSMRYAWRGCLMTRSGASAIPR